MTWVLLPCLPLREARAATTALGATTPPTECRCRRVRPPKAISSVQAATGIELAPESGTERWAARLGEGPGNWQLAAGSMVRASSQLPSTPGLFSAPGTEAPLLSSPLLLSSSHPDPSTSARPSSAASSEQLVVFALQSLLSFNLPLIYVNHLFLLA